MSDLSDYLLPVDDGLPTRESHEYARYKWAALEAYLTITNTAMRTKNWSARFYIDLQAGPGKNRIGNEVVLGSPLIALTSPYPPDQFFLNEWDEHLHDALVTRVSGSSISERVTSSSEDANIVVDQICARIEERDRKARREGKWSVFSVAFLDPEGLELEWHTIEKLAQMNRMDLIINFSTSGILRNAGAGNYDVINRFFGTEDWLEVYQQGSPHVRRHLIDFYRKNLEGYGYYVEVDPEWGSHDIRFRNSRNVEIYSLIFASKHPLGDQFWRQAGSSSQPPRLPGF